MPDEPERGGRPRGVTRLDVLLVLAALAALSVAFLLPPEPAGPDVAPSQFSAARAFAHVERVGATTHVIGSPANDRVREHLVATLSALGLRTRVQDAIGVNTGDPGEVEMARARNVVALLPGTAPTRPLFLVAHYDSVETGPGANDDGAGVSTILETVRALTAGPRLRNDVVVVLTDAEEACLCGAEAFVHSDPLAAGGGVVLNMEARGTRGPPIMFETARGNADLAGIFAGSAPHPVATSFAVEVYRILPNDTDFSVFRDAGRFTGLNTAYIDGSAAYHTPQDTADRMDRGSLQAMGDNTLALTRALGDEDLARLARPAGGDATYFPVLGGIARYPGALVWPLAVLAVVAVAVLAIVQRRRHIPLRRTAAGFGLALVPLLLAPLAAQAAWAVLTALRPDYAIMDDPWRPGWYRLGVVMLVLAVLLGWYALVRRRVGPAALAVGALGWLAVLGVVFAVRAPGGSYLTAIPALTGALAGVAALSRRAIVRTLATLLAAAVAIVVLVPTIVLFFPALGLVTAGAPALFSVLLGLALLPVLDLLFPRDPAVRRRRRGGVAPLAAAVAAVALFATGLAVDTFDARHPVPTQLMYALDADERRAWWVSTESAPTAWTRQYVGGDRADLAAAFPVFKGRPSTGPAQVADLPAPELEVRSTVLEPRRREVSVRLRSQRAARLVVVRVSAPRAVVSAVVNGRDVPASALGADRLSVTFHAPPAGGVVATFVVTGDGPVTVRALDGTDGLGDVPGFRPRPAGVDQAGSHTSDLLVVGTSRELE